MLVLACTVNSFSQDSERVSVSVMWRPAQLVTFAKQQALSANIKKNSSPLATVTRKVAPPASMCNFCFREPGSEVL